MCFCYVRLSGKQTFLEHGWNCPQCAGFFCVVFYYSMKISSFAFPFTCTLLAPGALTGAPSAVLKNTRPPFTSIQRKNQLIKNGGKLLFFFVFWFIKLIKHLDHDPAETENAPFIKFFGHDYPLPCNLSPCSGQAGYRLELIALNSHFASV